MPASTELGASSDGARGALAPPLTSYRARLYRLVFAAAGAYNLAFGLWAGLWPETFFDLCRLPRPLYPAVWQCLGMVVGVYGLLYLHAARRLDQARAIIAVGLLGKVLGPAGWVLTVASGEWPLRTFPLIAFNDLVWWLPFSLFLLAGTPVGERLSRLAPFACALANAAAALALALALAPGLPAEPDLGARIAHALAHPVAWRLGWLLWIAAALTLIWFYAWWGERLRAPRIAALACALAAAGAVSDILVESVFASWPPQDVAGLATAAAALTGGVANGLYTLAGILLTLSRPRLPPLLLRWAWLVWAAGLALSAASFAGAVPAIAAASAVLFALFCPWAWWLGMRLR